VIGATSAQVHASIRQHTDIPAQNLDEALRALSADRGLQLVYLSESVQSLQTEGAVGELTVDEALTKLLSGSGLVYKYVDENTVSIFPRAVARSRIGDNAALGHDVWDRSRVAQLGREAAQPMALEGDAAASPGASERVEEVVVTAQKRKERI